jgi:hypothetical protein
MISDRFRKELKNHQELVYQLTQQVIHDRDAWTESVLRALVKEGVSLDHIKIKHYICHNTIVIEVRDGRRFEWRIRISK